MLARGDVDLVAIGRAVLSDPEWGNKVRRNAMDELLPFNVGVLAQLV
jgi:2,4-dienoyl-CoA reductase-like NADH-dependent reductase (Old Yellow Enzyme family)